MSRTSSVSRTANRPKLSASQQAVLTKILQLNKKAKLGSYSIRFQVVGSRKELSPQEAIDALARRTGEQVTAVLVTWKTFRGGGKIGAGSRKVRTKVRNIDPETMANVSELERAWKRMEKEATSDDKPTTTAASRRAPVVVPSGPDQKALVDLVDALSGPAFDDPEVGMTVWTFHTRDVDRSLDPDEVVRLMKKGQGVFVLELVYDEDYELVQRGDGMPMRTVDDLLTLRDGRFRHMVDPDSFHAKNPALAMAAPTDTKARTSTPWHPSTMLGHTEE